MCLNTLQDRTSNAWLDGVCQENVSVCTCQVKVHMWCPLHACAHVSRLGLWGRCWAANLDECADTSMTREHTVLCHHDGSHSPAESPAERCIERQILEADRDSTSEIQLRAIQLQQLKYTLLELDYRGC